MVEIPLQGGDWELRQQGPGRAGNGKFHKIGGILPYIHNGNILFRVRGPETHILPQHQGLTPGFLFDRHQGGILAGGAANNIPIPIDDGKNEVVAVGALGKQVSHLIEVHDPKPESRKFPLRDDGNTDRKNGHENSGSTLKNI